jgi:hypothetical protein
MQGSVRIVELNGGNLMKTHPASNTANSLKNVGRSFKNGYNSSLGQ